MPRNRQGGRYQQQPRTWRDYDYYNQYYNYGNYYSNYNYSYEQPGNWYGSLQAKYPYEQNNNDQRQAGPKNTQSIATARRSQNAMNNKVDYRAAVQAFIDSISQVAGKSACETAIILTRAALAIDCYED